MGTNEADPSAGPPPRWLGWRAPWPAVALPIVVGFFQVMGSLGAADNQPDREPIDLVAIVLLLTGPLALTLRRRHPVAVLAVTMVATVLYMGLGYPYGPVFLSLVIALVTAVMQGRRLAAWLTAGLGYVAYLASGPFVDDPPTFVHAAAVAAWLGVVLALAEVARVRGERAAEAEHARAEQARRRASEERLRIARELHDVLAHNISMINVQAGVALHLIDERPEQARSALAAIKEASGEALREVRSVLGMLRQVDEPAPRDPAPSLARLDTLVFRAEAAGLRVQVQAEGEPRPLPAGLDLAAFRIVQEALTNVARHAGATIASVRVDYGADALTVEVDDDGGGVRSSSTAGTGSGIVGMRERAVALGGAAAGRTSAGGRLPGTGHLPAGDAVIRVLLADDQALVRAGFRALLDAQDGIEVVGEAADGEEAIRQAKTLRPDVVLMDIRMPGVDGLAATRAIAGDERLSGVRIVILSTFDLDEYVFDALRSGASGFLVKDTEPVELVRAVRAVVGGDALLSPGVTRRLIEEFAARRKDPAIAPSLDVLTEREREVMALAGQGLSNDEIAARLFMSVATAKTHVSRAMIKLGARDRAQLVVFAYESGLVRPGWQS